MSCISNTFKNHEFKWLKMKNKREEREICGVCALEQNEDLRLTGALEFLNKMINSLLGVGPCMARVYKAKV